jgi:hypothetical protein
MGAVSGAVGKTTVAPIERVFLKIATQNYRQSQPDFMPYNGYIDCVTRILREEGNLKFLPPSSLLSSCPYH